MPRKNDDAKHMFGILSVILVVFFIFMVLLFLKDEWVWISDIHFVVIGFVFFACLIFAFFSLTMKK